MRHKKSRHCPGMAAKVGAGHSVSRLRAERAQIYLHHAIESLNSVARKATKNRKVFPHDQATMKVVYLAIDAAAKKWSMPLRN